MLTSVIKTISVLTVSPILMLRIHICHILFLFLQILIIYYREPEDDELIHISKHHLRENAPKNVTDEEILNLSRNVVRLYNDVSITYYIV